MKKELNSYFINKMTNGQYTLCKILGEYDSEEQAKDNLITLSCGNTTEKKLLKEYAEKKEQQHFR